MAFQFKKLSEIRQEIETGPTFGKCLLRKSYRCPFKGIYFKNRCVVRQGPTVTGRDYVSSDDDSIPWDEEE